MSTGLPAWSGSQALRGSLRPGAAAPPPFDDGEPLVVRVDPADGASGVFRDAPVIVSLSQPADAATVGPASFRVEAGDGPRSRVTSESAPMARS